MSHWVTKLRSELAKRAREHAVASESGYYESRGRDPVVLFTENSSHISHGNFAVESYRAIAAHTSWCQRLTKPHTRRSALPPEQRSRARELDSCNSSDALLMNCFCYPTAIDMVRTEFLPWLKIAEPEFGVSGNVPFE